MSKYPFVFGIFQTIIIDLYATGPRVFWPNENEKPSSSKLTKGPDSVRSDETTGRHFRNNRPKDINNANKLAVSKIPYWLISHKWPITKQPLCIWIKIHLSARNEPHGTEWSCLVEKLNNWTHEKREIQLNSKRIHTLCGGVDIQYVLSRFPEKKVFGVIAWFKFLNPPR